MKYPYAASLVLKPKEGRPSYPTFSCVETIALERAAGSHTGHTQPNGPMGQWTNGPMDQWSNGPMGQWTNGPIDQWNIGTLKHWKIASMD